jgi:hypothetical protein
LLGHKIAIRIRAHRREAQSLGVWWWTPGLYVEAGMMPATRHVIGHYVIDPHPLRDRFRQTFLADLKRRFPEVFVDAVAPGCFMWKWKGDERIESFSELIDFIANDYRHAEEIRTDGSSHPIRIFVRQVSITQGNIPVDGYR